MTTMTNANSTADAMTPERFWQEAYLRAYEATAGEAMTTDRLTNRNWRHDMAKDHADLALAGLQLGISTRAFERLEPEDEEGSDARQ